MNVQKKIAIGFIRAKLNILSRLHTKKAGEEAFRLFCTPIRKPAKESIVFNNSERLQFNLDGKQINGFRLNPSPDKVLILHGFSSSCHKFDHFVAPLLNKNYEVLAFDAPAHGASAGKTVNALQYSNMIREVIGRYGPVNKFIAHSFGGISLILALEDLQIPGSRVALIAPATETTSAIDNAFSILGLKNKQVRDTLDEIIFQKSGKDTAWFSIRRAIKNVDAKILWIHDEEDNVTPYADAWKVKNDNNPHINFVTTNGLGHHKIYRNEKVKQLVVDFL